MNSSPIINFNVDSNDEFNPNFLESMNWLVKEKSTFLKLFAPKKYFLHKKIQNEATFRQIKNLKQLKDFHINQNSKEYSEMMRPSTASSYRSRSRIMENNSNLRLFKKFCSIVHLIIYPLKS